MNINEILDKMSHDITILTMGEKMFGGIVVTLFCMGIVFFVLVLLVMIIKLMEYLINPKSIKILDENSETIELETKNSMEDSSELVAAISGAIAFSMGISESSIKVVNINRVYDNTPTWAKNGRAEQLKTRL